VSNFDDLLAQQLAADDAEEQLNDEDDGDDDADDDDEDSLDELSESELLARAAAQCAAGEFEAACSVYSVVLERRREGGEADTSAGNAAVYLAYGAALFKNAVKSIDALGHTILAAGAANLEQDAVKQQLVQHGSTAMDDLELAFQVLECARTAYLAQDSAALSAELADTYALLADVNLENDNFADARSDLLKAIDADARAPAGARKHFVADVHHKIGVSYLSEKNKPAAKPHLAQARTLLHEALALQPPAEQPDSADANGKAKVTADDRAAAAAAALRKQLETQLAEVDARLQECDPNELETAAAAINAADAAAAAAPRRNAFDAPRNSEAQVENLGTLGGMRVKRKSDAITSTSTAEADTSAAAPEKKST
jgi:hypothetical protein